MSLSIQQALAINNSSEGFIVYSKSPVREMNEKLDKIIDYITDSINNLDNLEETSIKTRVLIELHLREIRTYVESLRE